ncbi:adenosylcobinamide-GDP ribazoletransferase [Photobacterium jeanii]|uniref:Adenosylcobinamide-GDP ribazoletransferase n=1 Tax=Photobacterium jeanii TaxID=858640 RepID=A0A178KQH9_9GAMM|nr:adenosylcobinamide-GDP ribazoletransferase [Photobacterium jeanii]OAN18812.1 adenosylcobinamide-GDP ribazoletransferase [Photobacterium jeanii]PST92791.1 adenosylcobinamide-GDP ribazoletransferase [Photobacterium jeanii]
MADGECSPLKKQWQIFLVALAFFTRIPIPANTPYSSERLNQANRYFGLVGCIVGACSALVYLLAASLLTPPLAIGLAIATSLLLTGAFHEDGLADVFDGFGGGWTVEQKLSIMKDSRLGTYGAAALVVCIGTKWLALSTLAEHSVWLPALALFSLHGLSRVCAASLIFSYPYVRADQTSKVKPLANQQTQLDLWVLMLTALVLLALFPLATACSLALCLIFVRYACGKWFKRQLGGYTGDCLGAAQQLSEVSGYLLLVALSASSL